MPAVARKVPRALRYRNLRNGDGKLTRHVLSGECWRVLITLIIDAVLPNKINDDEAGGKPVILTYDRFCQARKCDKCILTVDAGVNRRLHMPIYVEPTEPGMEWAACTLTQLPDYSWRAAFTHIPDFVQAEYERSGAPSTLIRFGRNCGGRRIKLAALI